MHVYPAVKPALTAINNPIHSVWIQRTSVGAIGFIASPAGKRRSGAFEPGRTSHHRDGSRQVAADAHGDRTCRRARSVRGTSARRGCSRVPTSPSPPSKTGLRWSASGQVSWLSDRPTPRAFPASRPVTLAGFVPDYSDGVAAASHRLPWALMGAPNAETERIRKELRGQYAPRDQMFADWPAPDGRWNSARVMRR